MARSDVKIRVDMGEVMAMCSVTCHDICCANHDPMASRCNLKKITIGDGGQCWSRAVSAATAEREKGGE